MIDARFELDRARSLRSIRALESNLLEALDRCESILDSIEKLRGLNSKGHAMLDKRLTQAQVDLDDPDKKVAAQRRLADITRLRKEYDTTLKKTEQQFDTVWRRTRSQLRQYIGNKKDFDNQLIIRQAVVQANKNAGAGSGGMTLLGRLGEIVLAYSAVKGFGQLDRMSANLDKLAKR